MSDLLAATWNINSIRARLERLVNWLDRHGPDVVCLQETKCTDDQFPFDELREVGYHAVVHGQPTYNGVAILTREPIDRADLGLPGDASDMQARFIAARAGGIRFVNVYVPNGKAVGTDKYDYKLAWLARLEQWMAEATADDEPLVLCGDFNIAPSDEDAALSLIHI